MTAPRAFAPLTATHPLVVDGDVCAGCGEIFVAGDVTTLVPIGPGGDEEQRERAREGRRYNAAAVPAHYACVTGRQPDAES